LISFFNSISFSSLLATKTTSLFFLAKVMALALPIPELAPVITIYFFPLFYLSTNIF